MSLPPPMPTPTAWLPIVVAALVASGLTWLWARRRRPSGPPLRRLGRGAGFRPFGEPHPGTGDGHSIWFAPADFAETLALRLAVRGPVLLLGPAARVSITSLPIWGLDRAQPSARQVVEAAAVLARDGLLPVVVVAGAAVLEPAAAGRPQAALEELLRTSPYPVFVILEEGAPVPEGPWPRVAGGELQ